MPGIAVEVRRRDGSRAQTGETGEIFVGGHVVMAGYLRPDGTVDAPELDDGAIASGDLGHFDVKGNLVVSGRAKDMIVTGGFNVFPAEVENVLREHPGVRDVCVVGVPDRRLGEVGCAVMVPASPGGVDEQRHFDSGGADQDGQLQGSAALRGRRPPPRATRPAR